MSTSLSLAALDEDDAQSSQPRDFEAVTLVCPLVEHDRRRYKRIRAPMYCRPLGTQFLARHHEPADVSLGGIRIYRNEKVRVGDLLEMEFFVPDGPPVACTGQVVWVDTLPRGGPARYDVGLKFVALDDPALNLLASLLGSPEE